MGKVSSFSRCLSERKTFHLSYLFLIHHTGATSFLCSLEPRVETAHRASCYDYFIGLCQVYAHSDKNSEVQMHKRKEHYQEKGRENICMFGRQKERRKTHILCVLNTKKNSVIYGFFLKLKKREGEMKQMGGEWLDCGIQLDYGIHSFIDFTLIKQSSSSFPSIYSALLQSISLPPSLRYCLNNSGFVTPQLQTLLSLLNELLGCLIPAKTMWG